MPRVKLRVPPVDPLKGVLLERQKALGLTDRAMSAKLGLSNATYSNMMKRSTDEWSLGKIKKACVILGIPKETLRNNI